MGRIQNNQILYNCGSALGVTYRCMNVCTYTDNQLLTGQHICIITNWRKVTHLATLVFRVGTVLT